MTRSREPVTIEDVKAAYDELRDEGTTPSARTIRARLGRGSFSTLQEMLLKITDGLLTPEDELKAFSQRLHDLCMEMTFHVDELMKTKTANAWEEVEKARANVEKQAKETQSKLDTAHTELKHERANNAELKERHNRLTQYVSDLQDKLSVSEEAAAILKADLSATRAKLEGTQTALEEARAQRTHYETMVAKQRQAEEEKFSNVIAGYQQTIEKMRAAEIVKAEEVATCRAVADQMEKELRETQQRLGNEQEQHAEERHNAARLQAELTAQIEQNRMLDEQARDQHAQLKNIHGKIETKEEAIAKLSEETETLRMNLLTFQQDSNSKHAQYHAEKSKAVHTVLSHAMTACKLASKVIGPDNRELTALLANQEQLEKLFG